MDYPSLLASTDQPASLNAQKKAKRKRKQQHEHLQETLSVPVQLPLAPMSGEYKFCLAPDSWRPP